MLRIRPVISLICALFCLKLRQCLPIFVALLIGSPWASANTVDCVAPLLQAPAVPTSEAAPLPSAVSERRTGEKKNLLTPHDLRIENRALFIAHYKTMDPTTKDENLRMMRFVEQPNSGLPVVYLTTENAELKALNSQFKDKDFVTALTNFHKQKVFAELQRIYHRELSPGGIYHYSDYKSTRHAFVFQHAIPSDFDHTLARIWNKVNEEFEAELHARQLLRQEDRPSLYFRAGYGLTSAGSDMAARCARIQTASNNLMNYVNCRERLVQQHMKAKVLHGFLELKIPMSVDLFALLRKYDEPLALVEALRKTFQLTELDLTTAEYLIDYKKTVDEFSPGIWMAERVHLNLDEAEWGGFTADRMGLGALNLFATAEALQRSVNVEQALLAVREGERAVTAQFQQSLELFKQKASGFVDCTGDDCAGIAQGSELTLNEKQNLLQRFAEEALTRSFRVAFFGAGVDKTQRKELSFHGESIESILRELLRGQIHIGRTHHLIFAVDMQTQILGQGTVRLLFAQSPQLELNDSEILSIRMAFAQAVQIFNQLHATHYQAYRDQVVM